MALKQQRERMLEYVVERLRQGGESCEPFRKNLNLSGDFVSQYIKIVPSGLVLLCDRVYTESNFERCVYTAKKRFENVAVVFLKDGVTYFRAAMPKVVPKAEGRSFKQYKNQDLSRMIELTRAEVRCVEGTSGGKVFYYQPLSDRLNEAVATYVFQTCQFDYSHVTPDRFQPRDRTSKRIYQWTDKLEHAGPLKLVKRGFEFARKSLHACADMQDDLSTKSF